MQERSIVELIEESIDEGDIELPVFNRVALTLQKLLSQDNYGAKDIVNVIQKDQTLASRVLKVANSSFYAGLKPVKTIQSATVRLGIKSIINLVMVVTQKQSYRAQSKEFERWMSPLWSHALGVAVASRWLASRLGLNKLTEEAFMAGLLHDIGKLVLLKIMEELQKSESIPKDVSASIIDDILEAMHCHEGERLMRSLNMPEIYCQVVAKHHEADSSGDNIIVNLVKLSNITCHKLGIGLNHDPGIMLSTSPEAISLMASDLLLAELQVKLEEYRTSMEKLILSSPMKTQDV